MTFKPIVPVALFVLSVSVLRTQNRERVMPTSSLVWLGGNSKLAGSVSSDGRYISFVDWKTGDLSLHDVLSNKDRPIVAANNPQAGQGKVWAEESAISRDGTKVAYTRAAGEMESGKHRHELWIANMHGDPQPRRVYGESNIAFLGPRDWSPDGKWIAVLLELEDHVDRLALVSVAEGALRVLKTGRWQENSRMFFSPDGNWLAYDIPQGPITAKDIWIMAVDGSMDSKAVATRGDDAVMGWSPDGKHLLFASDRTGGLALWSIPVLKGRPHGSPELRRPEMGSVVPIGVTRAGAIFYCTPFGNRGGSIQVAAFDIKSGAVTSSRDVSTGALENNVNPNWSPDGKYLAYISGRGRPDAPPVIVIRRTDTLTVLKEFEQRLRRAEIAGWEPNSRALLAVGEDLDGRRGAFRLHLDSGEPTSLWAAPASPTLSMPAWSADGNALYYWNRVNTGEEHVFIAHDLASGAEKEIIRRPFLGPIMVSPDGRWLATETIDPARNELVLLLVPLEAGTPREMMRVPSGVPPQSLKNVAGVGARVGPASWLPDSQSFIARLQLAAEGESELWEVHIDGAPARKLPSLLDAHVFKFTISPDGRHVAYRFKEPGPQMDRQVWKFENFMPANSAAR